MAAAVGPRHEASSDVGFSSILPLAEVEKRAILEALRYTKGDRTTAANMLGIGRTTLYRKLRDYGLDKMNDIQPELR
jgi:transcriptional regulator of acetoin/glycerol metabolism